MTALVKYDAARRAVQIAQQVDEVKDIRDKAQALAAYARQANDTELAKWVTEIKLRAERRAGELLADSEKHKGGRQKETGAPETPVNVATLKSLGLSKKQSSQFQAIAAIPEKTFEAAVATGKATTASLVRSSQKSQDAPQKPKKTAPKEKKPAVIVEDEHAPDLGKELARADKEIRSLQALVESLQTSDLAKQLTRAHTKYAQLEGRLQQCLTTKAEAEKDARYQAGLLSKIRSALKVKQNSEILAALKS